MNNQSKKVAWILGGTGLVGQALVEQLKEDDAYGEIHLLSRRELAHTHPNIQVHVVDYNQPESWQDIVKGDVLFSSMGTTIKKAGSQEAQYKVDYTYQYETARAAASNGVPAYVLISSIGANSTSSVFYTRIKGELDRDVQQLGFSAVTILRPSVLDGDREEHRFGENIGIKLGHLLGGLPFFSTYRPIHVEIVAQAMRAAADRPDGTLILDSPDMFTLAKEKA
ncbi:MAG: NAD(P)H-binding protein [Bacteroidota bacterium]